MEHDISEPKQFFTIREPVQHPGLSEATVLRRVLERIERQSDGVVFHRPRNG